jgi:hypothetical protein
MAAAPTTRTERRLVDAGEAAAVLAVPRSWVLSESRADPHPAHPARASSEAGGGRAGRGQGRAGGADQYRTPGESLVNLGDHGTSSRRWGHGWGQTPWVSGPRLAGQLAAVADRRAHFAPADTAGCLGRRTRRTHELKNKGQIVPDVRPPGCRSTAARRWTPTPGRPDEDAMEAATGGAQHGTLQR